RASCWERWRGVLKLNLPGKPAADLARELLPTPPAGEIPTRQQTKRSRNRRALPYVSKNRTDPRTAGSIMSKEFGITGPAGGLTPLAGPCARPGGEAQVLAALLDALDQGVALLDGDYGLLYCNRTLPGFFGLDSALALE